MNPQGGRAMEVKCRVCGRRVEIAVWTAEYERLKSSDDPAYICEVCQQRIQAEAQEETSR